MKGRRQQGEQADAGGRLGPAENNYQSRSSYHWMRNCQATQCERFSGCFGFEANWRSEKDQ